MGHRQGFGRQDCSGGRGERRPHRLGQVHGHRQRLSCDHHRVDRQVLLLQQHHHAEGLRSHHAPLVQGRAGRGQADCDQAVWRYLDPRAVRLLCGTTNPRRCDNRRRQRRSATGRRARSREGDTSDGFELGLRRGQRRPGNRPPRCESDAQAGQRSDSRTDACDAREAGSG